MYTHAIRLHLQHKLSLLADLRVSAYLIQASSASARLKALYADRDGSLAAEVAALRAPRLADHFERRRHEIHEQYASESVLHCRGITAGISHGMLAR
jgi:hypothetical protein